MLGRMIARRFSTTVARKSEIHQHGLPGANLPFDIHNRYKLTAYFIIYFSSGLSLPYFLARYYMLKK
ncbi:hypothetical protein CHS0354_042234 [Potamilus streckersoni]|uniref:Cytochrome c oxidase subunit 7C, mitochondrial n=1 Tax=Potamilus streckersoni TaxID=2493646 RepID=A0AAE0STT0_9BIVA|nr:hypothetical protein CHS0354_042234 [Potamilus streckersoni]